MRVITGTARGRKLITLEGKDIRPTTDRVKEAIFSIIQFDIEGRKVLDLFAGSGQLGIEALSRGAASATFVDADKKAIDVVRKNLESCHLDKNANVIHADSLSFLSMRKDVFDIAFLDPPYGRGILQSALPKVAPLISTGGVILCESPENEELPDEAGAFKLVRQYRYGKVIVTLYRHKEVIDE